MGASADLVTVAKLYRDALRLVAMVSYQQNRPKEPLINMVRSSFRSQADLTDKQEILDAKQRGITALGNYYAVKAYDIAMQEKEDKHAKMEEELRRSKRAKAKKNLPK
eukprot:jgi/Ulvmu1/3409/UM016_0027.1